LTKSLHYLQRFYILIIILERGKKIGLKERGSEVMEDEENWIELNFKIILKV